MHKLHTKTLLPPSFSQKCSTEWSISNLSLVETGPKTGVLLGPTFDIPESSHVCSYLLVPMLIVNKPRNANSTS